MGWESSLSQWAPDGGKQLSSTIMCHAERASVINSDLSWTCCATAMAEAGAKEYSEASVSDPSIAECRASHEAFPWRMRHSFRMNYDALDLVTRSSNFVQE